MHAGYLRTAQTSSRLQSVADSTSSGDLAVHTCLTGLRVDEMSASVTHSQQAPQALAKRPGWFMQQSIALAAN